MSWSLKLFTVRGIAVRVHASFLLVILWAAYIGLTDARGTDDWLRGAAFMILFILLLFTCVVLHELGHSLVAQLFGARVQDITLWPIGGVARMTKMPEKPYQEFLMTAAGPATNILLVIGLGALAVAWIGLRPMYYMLSMPWMLELFLSRMNGQALLLLLVANNAALALFNLVPAFPMDGGRLLRSLLASFLPFSQATRVASWVGQVLAVIMIVIALLPPGNYWLALVGMFVFMAAWQERQQTMATDHLRGLRVRSMMQPVGQRLHPLQTLGEAAAYAAVLPQSVYAVVDGGRLVGMMGRGDLLAAVRKAGPAVRVAQHMSREVLRLGPDDLLSEAQARLAQKAFGAAMVVEEGQVVGTLSRADLVRLIQALDAYPGAVGRQA